MKCPRCSYENTENAPLCARCLRPLHQPAKPRLEEYGLTANSYENVKRVAALFDHRTKPSKWVFGVGAVVGLYVFIFSLSGVEVNFISILFLPIAMFPATAGVAIWWGVTMNIIHSAMKKLTKLNDAYEYDTAVQSFESTSRYVAEKDRKPKPKSPSNQINPRRRADTQTKPIGVPTPSYRSTSTPPEVKLRAASCKLCGTPLAASGRYGGKYGLSEDLCRDCYERSETSSR